MKLTTTFTAPSDLKDLKVDLLTVCVAEGALAETPAFAAIDGALGGLDGLLGRAAADEQFKAKKGSQLSLHTHGKVAAGRVLLLGAGAGKELRPSDTKALAGRAVRAAIAAGATSVAFVPPPFEGAGGASAMRLVAEHAAAGAELGAYRFEKYWSADRRTTSKLAELTVVMPPAAKAQDAALARAIERGTIVAQAVALARDLVNEPAGTMTPRRMADVAHDLAREHELECEVLGPEECRKLGMGMYLAVAQGSAEEPRFIHLAYKPSGKPQGKAPRKVALVGKGVTFDSGGLSLKPNESMLTMKTDMAGAAAVLSAIAAVAQLGAPVEVHAFAACTENMPGGRAYKLGDVLRSMNGKTVEINNTDAEGRLTLGDAITYAVTHVKPDELVDLATLTGACMVALGPHTAGVMGNKPEMIEGWLAAAKTAGEEMWNLPLPEALREQLKSEVADMRNTGERYGGALTAGLFLKEFAGETPWVHVDIAGPSTTDKTDGHLAKGATGVGVATIVEYLAPRG